MKELICKKCNGQLHIEKGEDSITCPYCGTQYLLCQDDFPVASEKEKWLQDIEKLIKAGEWKKCDKLFKKLFNQYPADYEVYWKYVSYLTDDFESMLTLAASFDKDVAKYADNAILFAPDHAKEEMREKWTSYLSRRDEAVKCRELERKNEDMLKVQDIIKRNLKPLSGAYFGSSEYSSTNLFWELGRLKLRAKERYNRIVFEEDLSEHLEEKEYEVYFDDEAFLMYDRNYTETQLEKKKHKFLFFSWTTTKAVKVYKTVPERVRIEGFEVQLREILLPLGSSSFTCATFRVGNQKKLCVYHNFYK